MANKFLNTIIVISHRHGERYSSEHNIENHTIGREIKEKYIPSSCATNLPSSHKKI